MKKESKKKMRAGIILLMAYLAVLFGCASGGDEGTEPAPLNKIFLTTSDFQTGGIGIINLDNLKPWEPDPGWAKDVASSDALAVFFQGKIFVINRMPQDNISVLEFDENRNLQLINQYSVKGKATSANPYDLAFITSERAYLSRYETEKLWVINPETGDKIKTIDLSKYADDDGIPEMAFMLVRGFYVYLSLQWLDRTTPWWDPVGESYLLKINRLTDQVEGKILLSTPDPVTDLIWNEDLGKILVGEVGNYGELDGGIDGIDPSTGTAQLIISEEQLGGDISDFVLLSADTGYAGITTTDWSASKSKVIAFNPSTGKVIKEVYSTNASFPFDLELDGNGRLFITDRGNAVNPGVVVIDTSTNKVITNQPIEFTLPPYSLCRLE